jgi:hypothetical protein
MGFLSYDHEVVVVVVVVVVWFQILLSSAVYRETEKKYD